VSDRLISSSGQYEVYIQNDGNLVVYRMSGDTGTPIWASGQDPNPTPPIPPSVTLPRLVVNGQMFAQEDGSPFTAIQCSDFNLFARFQAGENLTPVLSQRSTCGFNMLRVWTLFDIPGIGTLLNPQYTLMRPFLRLCAQYGLYVELTAFTSTERESHWGALLDAVVGEPNVLVELVNEGTLPVNQINMGLYPRPVGILASHGSGGSEGVPPWEPWDYCTFHTNGASEEQRKIGHNAMSDLADPLGVPALTNETSRFPEVGMWVGADAARQSMLAYDSAAGAALLCAGSCFHSVLGKTSTLWDDRTETTARAWASGAASVPLGCQHAPYRHREDLETPDLLRVYQRGTLDSCIVEIHK